MRFTTNVRGLLRRINLGVSDSRNAETIQHVCRFLVVSYRLKQNSALSSPSLFLYVFEKYMP